MSTTAPVMPHVPTIDTSHRIDWTPTVLLLVAIIQGSSIGTTLVFRLAPSSGLAAITVNVIWLVMYVLAAYALISRHGLNWLVWLSRYRLPLLVFVACAAVSTAWSLHPALTAERSIHFAGSTLIAIAIGFTVPLHRIVRLSTWFFGILMAVNVMVSLLAPSVGIENYEGQLVWRGILSSKNTLGFWAATAALLFTTRLFHEHRLNVRALLVFCIFMALLNLVQSSSATSLLALVFSGLVMIYLYSARSLSLGIIATTCLGLVMLALAALAFQYINTAELIGRSGDLTGRGSLWAQVWDLVAQRPLTGYGYGAIWNPTADTVWIQQTLLDLNWISYHAHNGLLQVASELGLPIMVLAAVFAILQLVEVIYGYNNSQPEGSLFVLGFCVALLVSNYSEARLLDNRELFWILFVALPISLMRQVVVVADKPQRSALLRRLTPSVRDGLVRRRHNVRTRTALKRRLVPRSGSHSAVSAQELTDAIIDPAQRDSEMKIDRMRVKLAKSRRLDKKPGAKPPENS